MLETRVCLMGLLIGLKPVSYRSIWTLDWQFLNSASTECYPLSKNSWSWLQWKRWNSCTPGTQLKIISCGHKMWPLWEITLESSCSTGTKIACFMLTFSSSSVSRLTSFLFSQVFPNTKSHLLLLAGDVQYWWMCFSWELLPRLVLPI